MRQPDKGYGHEIGKNVMPQCLLFYCTVCKNQGTTQIYLSCSKKKISIMCHQHRERIYGEKPRVKPHHILSEVYYAETKFMVILWELKPATAWD
jgi:hypothetical protein